MLWTFSRREVRTWIREVRTEGSVGERVGLMRSWRISRTDMVRVGILGLREIRKLSSFIEF